MILRHMMLKENFLKYKKFLDKLELEGENKVLLDTLGTYYLEHPEEREVTLSNFRLFFNLRNPVLKKKDIYLNLLESLNESEVNPKLLNESLRSLIERHYSATVINSLIPVLDGTKSDVLSSVHEVLDEFEDSIEHLSETAVDLRIVQSTIAEMIAEQVTNPGLKWRLHCLNHDIGDLRGSSLGHIFARVDTGKTTFIASEAANWAPQLKPGEEIWWYNNEEEGSKVKFRIVCASTGMSKAEIAARPGKAEEIFKRNNGDAIVVIDSSDTSIEDMERDLTNNPQIRMIIVDQGDKVKFRGRSQYSTVDALKVLYGKFRELQKKFKIDIVTVGQADGAAEGKKWLRLTNMDYSKTGKPGELDWAIGIGASFDGPDYARYICICKNKMKDGHHGLYEVTIDAMIAQYHDTPIVRRDQYESSVTVVVPQPESIGYAGTEEGTPERTGQSLYETEDSGTSSGGEREGRSAISHGLF